MGVLGAAKGFDCKVCLYISGDQPYREREVILEAMREKVMGVLTVSCLEDGQAEYAPSSPRTSLWFSLNVRGPNRRSVPIPLIWKKQPG